MDVVCDAATLYCYYTLNIKFCRHLYKQQQQEQQHHLNRKQKKTDYNLTTYNLFLCCCHYSNLSFY